MSIPGVFSPVRDGEKIYVGGGLVGNVPADVVRKMGADIVIAVHFGRRTGKPERHSIAIQRARTFEWFFQLGHVF